MSTWAEVGISAKKRMTVWWQDAMEWYIVCPDCYSAYSHMQWSGNSRHRLSDKEHERIYCKAEKATECEFCGPHGNGGPASVW